MYRYGNGQISLSDSQQPLCMLLDQKLGHFTDWSNCHLKLCTGETCKAKIVIQRHSANNGSMFTDFLFHHLRGFFRHLIQAEPDDLTLAEDEIALLDMEAGVEHFGRGTDNSVDGILMIVDPSFESLYLSAH